jgi:hypothetical protein
VVAVDDESPEELDVPELPSGFFVELPPELPLFA